MLDLAEGLVKSGVEDDWLDWLTGSEEMLKVGEYLLGDDPQSAAERTRHQLAIALARSFADHPDFNPRWAR